MNHTVEDEWMIGNGNCPPQGPKLFSNSLREKKNKERFCVYSCACRLHVYIGRTERASSGSKTMKPPPNTPALKWTFPFISANRSYSAKLYGEERVWSFHKRYINLGEHCQFQRGRQKRLPGSTLNGRIFTPGIMYSSLPWIHICGCQVGIIHFYEQKVIILLQILANPSLRIRQPFYKWPATVIS